MIIIPKVSEYTMFQVYLNHLPVIFASYLHITFPYHYETKSQFLNIALLNLFIAYLLGLQASMLSEFPFLNIERSMRNYYKKPQQTEEN